MRISDWSSDVCSSDLAELALAAAQVDVREAPRHGMAAQAPEFRHRGQQLAGVGVLRRREQPVGRRLLDRKSVVEGKSVAVRVDLGGRRIIKKKKKIIRNIKKLKIKLINKVLT